MTRLLGASPDTARAITEHRKIKRFRNVIVHGYDTIDHETTWDVVRNKLPVLRRELAGLMPSPPPLSPPVE